MPKVITVFGATGGQGGGVVSALLKAINSERKDYAVRAITRNPDGAKGQELKSKGCEVVKCDLDDKESVEKAIRGSYGVFLVTNYWEHFSKEKEIEQGKRVIDVCEALGVKHLIYSGLEHVKKVIGIECEHFDSKGIVEEYLHTKKPEEKLNFTIVRFSAYFNNFAGFFKPRRMNKNTFIFDIPMEGAPMDGVEVKQGGECVYGILEEPDSYRYKTIGLSTDKFTMEQYCEELTKQLSPMTFKDSQITLDQYRALGFPGAVELGNMFEFYKRGNPERDIALTKKLNPGLQEFKEWVQENKEMLSKSFDSIEIQSK
ncbi:unnamed protein product [Porites evermanni]|uniref:NmrA-like family domain-containing protein 1 n=1 Tax=Porites evermanni TaxID=104178 RepID=A0ABN8MIM3_9CNID|nr:unnamed protein product [Porites evermanni]